jgi:hypothetical protein
MVGQNIGNGSSKLRGGCHIDCSAGKKYRDAAKRLNVSLDRVLSQHEAAALLCAKKIRLAVSTWSHQMSRRTAMP